MAIGGNGVLSSTGLRTYTRFSKRNNLEDYVSKLAKNSLQMDSDGNVDVIGVINVGTAGGFYQGTGDFTTPTTGLKIWNDSGIGRIAGYNTGTAQWYADTDGKLYAGAGNVTLDATGIRLAIGATSTSSATWYDGATEKGHIYTTVDGTGSAMQIYATHGISSESATIALRSEAADLGESVEVGIAAVVDAASSCIFRVNVNGTRYFQVKADGVSVPNTGLNVGSASSATTGDVAYSADLEPLRGGVSYTGYVFVPLAAPLTSTSWDGDSYSTTAATLIDLSAVFGVPAGVKAILATVTINDTGSAGATDIGVSLNPTNGTWYLSPLVVRCGGLANSAYASGSGVVPCDANGDVYYQAQATGASSMTVRITIWGYWL